MARLLEGGIINSRIGRNTTARLSIGATDGRPQTVALSAPSIASADMRSFWGSGERPGYVTVEAKDGGVAL